MQGDARRDGRARWVTTTLAVVLAVTASGCVPLATRGGSAPPPQTPPPPVFTAITAPHQGRGGAELEALERFGTAPGALLRKAWLLQANSAWQDSLRPLNLVIHGDDRRDPGVEAIARWLRARMFDHLGDPGRAAADLGRARALATDPSLVTELDRTSRPAPELPARLADLAILPRGTWSAASARTRGMAPLGRIERVTVHHSATVARAGSQRASLTAVRAMQRVHQESRGWSDIGYHFLIDPSGRILEGRDLRWQGAHAGDPTRNRHNVGICLLGNYVPREQGAPPDAQLQALRRLLTVLCVGQGLGPDDVLTHQEIRKTECPGPYVQREIERFRTMLDQVAATRP